MAWMGNSPDLNSSKPVWPWIKRRTTAKGPPKTRQDAERVWKKRWDEIPQELLQGFVNRIREHIKRVIELDGGNKYGEGLHTRK
jgi:hypothetical protein